MKRQELFVFRTRDVQHVISVTLCKYTFEWDSKAEYVVQVYEYTKGRLRDLNFDDISAAKRRFLFEVENATIFAEE